MIEDRSGASIDWKKEYEKECELSMMAGSQLSALRLQLKDAEARAASVARPEAGEWNAAIDAAAKVCMARWETQDDANRCETAAVLAHRIRDLKRHAPQPSD